MNDVLLDTNLLSDLLAVFYSDAFRTKRLFYPYQTLTSKIVRELNRIVRWHDERLWNETEELPGGLVVASTFAFVEIARQFDKISNHRFSVVQMKAFIDQPPAWFFITSLDETILPHLAHLPTIVQMRNGNQRSVELADSLHIATALSRDHCLIATTDAVLKAIDMITPRLL